MYISRNCYIATPTRAIILNCHQVCKKGANDIAEALFLRSRQGINARIISPRYISRSNK